MLQVFGYLSPFTWVVILCWLIYFVGRFFGRRRLPTKARTTIKWPDRSLRPFGQRPFRSRPVPVDASSELEVQPPGAASVNSLRMLFVVTLDDRAAVERLIGYELGLAPGIGRNAAIVRAYERWMDDNR